jgi:glutaminyl-peptide cyclotransferase
MKNQGKQMTNKLLALSLLLILASCGREKPADDPQPMDMYKRPPSIASFSGDRAFELLVKQTDFGPRDPNSSAHEACFRFMKGFLEPLCDDVKVQEFSLTGYDGDTLRLKNLIAKINPSAKRRVLLCAHWDSRPAADRETDPEDRKRAIPGANDGASGAAVLLHLAELLRTRRPKVGVDIALFDGEDYGREGDESMYCLGSKYYAATLPEDDKPIFGILLDLVGDKDAEFPQEQASVQYAGDIAKLVWSIALQEGISRFKVKSHGAIIDDHTPLNVSAGIKTIDIIDADLVGQTAADPRRKYWHTLHDTPEQCSPKTLEDVGRVLALLVYGMLPS